MSDNLRRDRALRDAFIPWDPDQPTGTVARHLTTLAALISGIVGSTSTQLPSVATTIPDGTKPESRGKRLTRWLENARLLEEMSFLPSADVLLRPRALPTVVLVMDGSGVGRGWTALMLHVVSKGRTLPLAWRGRQAPQGHLPADLHIAVVAVRREGSPAGANVGLLGDGECDGTALQATRHEAGWCYGGRTAMSPVATWEGETFRLDTLGACRKPGTRIALQEAQLTRDVYGPVMVLSGWAKGHQAPLYVVSNMTTAEQACRLYAKRFRMEPFFSDQKSRGCHLHKSPIADVQRLSR